MKQASHKEAKTILLYLYEVSKVAKIIETEGEWWLPGVGYMRKRGLVFNQYGVLDLHEEKVLEGLFHNSVKILNTTELYS